MRKNWLASTFFIFLLCILLTNTFKTEVFAQEIPKISIVSLDHVPFVAGDKNEFYISAKNYAGEVQYQLFYIQESAMKEWKLINNTDMINGWTSSVDAKAATIVDISTLNLKADKYRFAIRVRRVGAKGLKQNSYGDYDDAYPFNLNVVKTASIDLRGNMNIMKTNFTKSENLVIDGVGDLSENIQYKLHLFDVKNSKWLTDLTEYTTSVNYSLKGIPEGTYIVDLWAKSINSKNKYDGWKLKTITVENSLVKDDVVRFPDATLDKVIRKIINKPYGDIYRTDVEKIESVEWYFNAAAVDPVPEEEMIFDLSGIENLTNLKVLNLLGNSVSDLSPLRALTNLTELNLYYNDLSDISALAGLTNLTQLDLSDNGISNISPLAALTKLTSLSLNNNEISDISALAKLTNLDQLDLYHNNISDISALKGLTNLTTYLHLSENKISDISALKGLTNLTGLDLSENQISNISPLKGLTNLKDVLDLGKNQISDISALSALTNLDILDLNSNKISNISDLKGFTNLTLIDLTNNQISDISVLSGATNLSYLILSENQISDISPLAGLTDLTVVSLAHNKISDISKLVGLTNLISLDLENNNISDISSLKGMTNLIELYLSNNKISDADMKALKNALPEGVEFN